MDEDVVLITGSSGLIGAAAVVRFAAEYRVIGFDREGAPHPPAKAECVCVDLTSDESVRAGMECVRYAHGDRIAAVIHLAAYYDFSGEPNPLYDELTVRGTERLLRHLANFQVGQFVFSSTMLVVHAPSLPGEPITEDSPLAANWAYPESKIKTEALLCAERGAFAVALLRLAGVYDDRCHSIPLAHQIQRIYERTLTSRVFPGDLSHGQAFVPVDDVVDALWLTVEKRTTLPPETVLLVGEEETLSYDELQPSIARLVHGEDWETSAMPEELAKAAAWLQDQIPGQEPFIKPWMIDRADDHLCARHHTRSPAAWLAPEEVVARDRPDDDRGAENGSGGILP